MSSPSRRIGYSNSRQIRGSRFSQCAQSWSNGLIHVESKRWLGAEAEYISESEFHVVNVTTTGGTKSTGAKLDGEPLYEGSDRPGTVTFVPAGFERHGWATEADLRYVALYVHPRICASFPEIEVSHLRPRMNVQDPVIYAVLKTLSEDVESGVAPETSYVESALRVLAARLERPHAPLTEHGPASRGLSPREADVVKEYIHANIDQEITVADLAALVGMGARAFAGAFKVAFGVAPYQYVLRERLARARELLRTTSMPIASIAFATGFSSQSHLTTALRRSIGTPPLAYRQAHAK